MSLLPQPTLTLTKTEARRFLLAHHRLSPPRSLTGKAGILEFIRHVGCIQFDPIDVVGRNPDLVLQARVADYRRSLLEELLYADRRLLDASSRSIAGFLLQGLIRSIEEDAAKRGARIVGLGAFTKVVGDAGVTVAFSPDSARLVIPRDAATARIWDIATGQVTAVLEGRGLQLFLRGIR